MGVRLKKKVWAISPETGPRRARKRAARRGKTNDEVRAWYLRQVAKIPRLNRKWVEQGLSARERALKAWELRREARLDARAMMTDPKNVKLLQARDAARYGNPDGPSFEFLVAKHQREGLEGDAVYNAIVGSSNKTDAGFNEKFRDGEPRGLTDADED